MQVRHKWTVCFALSLLSVSLDLDRLLLAGTRHTQMPVFRRARPTSNTWLWWRADQQTSCLVVLSRELQSFVCCCVCLDLFLHFPLTDVSSELSQWKFQPNVCGILQKCKWSHQISLSGLDAPMPQQQAQTRPMARAVFIRVPSVFLAVRHWTFRNTYRWMNCRTYKKYIIFIIIIARQKPFKIIQFNLVVENKNVCIQTEMFLNVLFLTVNVLWRV